MKAGMSYKEQLQYLKGVTVRIGTIHEAQALQLRNYPLMIPGVQKATTKIDTENQIVYYDCEVPKRFRITKPVSTMCKNIVIWTRTILWDNTTIVVKTGDKVIHDTRS